MTKYIPISLLVIPLVMSMDSYCCTLPVFRYALERWEPDNYLLYIVNKGKFRHADYTKIQALKQQVHNNDSCMSNLQIVSVNSEQGVSPRLGEILQQYPPKRYPWVLLSYPEKSEMSAPVIQEKLSSFSSKNLTDSPIRRKIVKRLLEGHSVVWVLVKGRNPWENFKVSGLLKKTLKRMAVEITLPVSSVDQYPGWFDPNAGPPLKVHFSYLTVSPSNRTESVFVKMLLSMDHGKSTETAGPSLYAISGRGRMFFSLTQNKVTADNIEQVCRFLVGSCSCEIKAENPGVDLLMTSCWNTGQTGQPMVEEQEIPYQSLTGLIQSDSKNHQADRRAWKPWERRSLAESTGIEPVENNSRQLSDNVSRQSNTVVFFKPSSSSPKPPVHNTESQDDFRLPWIVAGFGGGFVLLLLGAVIIVIRERKRTVP